MMLWKRSRAAQKDLSRDQPMPESRNPSFFGLPGLLVGFAKGMADSDSARSPTSPLDYRVFSSFGSQLARSPRSPGAADADAPRKSWDCDRVGLRLVDSLSDADESGRRVLLGSSENRNILLGSQTRINIPSPKTRFDRLAAEGSATSPKSLPKNYVISPHTRADSPCFKPGSSERGPGLPAARLELGDRGFVASLSASDIEQSEDYTCIISRGPNPRKTRIFGDCILESCSGDVSDFSRNEQGEEGRGGLWMVKCSESPMSAPAEDFLRVCFSCKKQLEGKDIYMYRGEKAFCSCSCRSQGIMHV